MWVPWFGYDNGVCCVLNYLRVKSTLNKFQFQSETTRQRGAVDYQNFSKIARSEEKNAIFAPLERAGWREPKTCFPNKHNTRRCNCWSAWFRMPIDGYEITVSEYTFMHIIIPASRFLAVSHFLSFNEYSVREAFLLFRFPSIHGLQSGRAGGR